MRNMKLFLTLTLFVLISTMLLGVTNNRVDLYHFSDYHSHVLSFYSEGEHDIGGIARIMWYLKEINKDDENLVFNGGDMVNIGTPAWSDKYQHIEMLWTNNLVDAMAYGNHEGDYGRDVFNTVVENVSYPILGSNIVDESNNPVYVYDGKTYLTFERNKIKIGVFALVGTDFRDLVDKENRPVKNCAFIDREEVTKEVIEKMQNENCDVIVLIGHALEEEDIELAKAVKGIDIIFGTHSHLKKDLFRIEGTDTYMISPYQYGTYFCHVSVSFNEDGKKLIDGQLIRMGENIPKDPLTLNKVRKLQKKLEADPEYAHLYEVIGKAANELSSENGNFMDTKLGNLVVDLMRKSTDSNCALSTTSSFRGSIPPGELNYEGLKNAIPYSNIIYTYKMTGQQVLDLVKISLLKAGTALFSQVSGLKIQYRDNGLISTKILSDPESNHYEEIKKDKIYKVATTNYQGLYAAGYSGIFKQVDYTNTGIDIQQLVADHFRENSPVKGLKDNRIEKLK